MLQTVTGKISEHEAGTMLVHEHILVGFVKDAKLTSADYDRQEVVALTLPLLMQLKEAGCSTFVDCAPEYLGRDPYILKELSEKSGLYFITNTGFYKEPYLPSFVYQANHQELSDIWIKEARDGIGESGVYPGYIKIALNDGTAIDETQQKILRAAIRTSLETGLPIQCHTIGGDVALHANEIMKQAGFDRERFIWVHAQTGKDLTVHKQLADEGMWISIDSILPGTYDEHVVLLKQLQAYKVSADKILLSQDTGWYTVGEEKGGHIRPYHHLLTDFIPYAIENGLDASWLKQCVTRHPYQAMRIRV
ncbi:phosphotriesterase [Paenibacillus psychroresistens]|uniref:Phosphotriesterase n=1 Tax=Paenibacillus psychroresistens TaxID=1778678 RepID=A0A6B8RVR7_9BACL|nr:TatD family hydrolase [Paenibacillus psychroresistens]QGQ99735.1 phosphotriesterase [Paenibacillus psychroresistens]